MGCKCSDVGKDKQMEFEENNKDINQQFESNKNSEQNQSLFFNRIGSKSKEVSNNGSQANNNSMANNMTSAYNTIQNPIKEKKELSRISEEEKKEKNSKHNRYNCKHYANDVFEIINNVRENPVEFIKDIENAEKKIEYKNENKIIYAGELKVNLNKGLEVFKEAEEYLRQCSPMNKLIFDKSIIIPVPKNEEDMLNKAYYTEALREKKKECQIDAFYVDCIIDPYTSVLLGIIDDSGKNSGFKRKAYLNPEYKKLGISAGQNGKTFCAYYSFSK